MKLTINLKYDTIYGENLYIKGSVKSLHGKTGDGIPMEYVGNGSWAATFYTEAKSFKYHFYVLNGNAIVNTEEELSHRFESYGDAYKTILIFDHFGMYPKLPRILQSAALSKAIRHHKTAAKKKSMPKVPIVFNTWSTSVNFNHTLSIVGSHPSLGSWNENDAVAMEAIEYPNFTKILDANKLQFPLEYKYAITDPKNGTLLHWEESYNHILNPEISMATDLIIVNDITPHFNVPDLRIAGTAVPIFSLRTKESFGCGEFLDLKKLGDWAYKTGQRIIQTLPINDTTVFGSWRDSYPYSSISVFALHPMYLNLEKIGTLKNEAEYKKKRKELNNQEFVDYEAVNKQKWMFIHEQFSSYGEATFSSPDYKTFFESNKYWLKPYAVFSFLRYKHDTADFSQWGEDAVFNPKRIDGYCQSKSKNYKDVAVHFFVQYHLHTQLLESVQYLHSKGIALKGDIPIGVNRNSVDVWMQPRLFDCNGSAGAPPDYFTKTGQVWGFPIYDWQEMAKDDYSWWKNRLKSMSTYFDAYRIDHILGFFRIFRTPTTSRLGLLGQFTPALPLSKEEIESYGIPFDENLLCEPIINDAILKEIFGGETEFVIKNYLTRICINEYQEYQLNSDVNTQEKIDKKLGIDQKSDNIRKGLYLLCCQVMFVEDYKEKGKYHPRISITQSFLYKTLRDELQNKIREIYEYFHYRRHNEFWRSQALEKLTPLVNCTDMMVCGEDLGMVPQCVPSVMNDLEILSLEIQRMPKDYVEFESLNRMPRMSVCTTSTHDMSTMRQWWQEERDSIQHYFSNELHQYGEAPQFCEPWICQQIIENHLNSPSLCVILPLQDWMATDGRIRWSETFKERINDPGNPDNYWHYRMHIRIEDLLQADEFNERIKHLIVKSCR